MDIGKGVFYGYIKSNRSGMTVKGGEGGVPVVWQQKYSFHYA